jgi:hypothetical protein
MCENLPVKWGWKVSERLESESMVKVTYQEAASESPRRRGTLSASLGVAGSKRHHLDNNSVGAKGVSSWMHTKDTVCGQR